MSVVRGNEVGTTDAGTLRLPDAPASCGGKVKAWAEPVDMLTWLPAAPDRNPMFLEKRVYQGSSGRVYPLPVIDRIASAPEIKTWQAVHIENEFLRLMILPEIGGRIHIGYDKTSEYDFFYRQNVIKPALVGLAGPWISGGVEFNWPQHHRPATFMPVETAIEHDDDGSVTVWCSDHDPMLRMKGMHGICLHPGRAVVELKVRLFNRTPLTQTFLWWANVATRVHEQYQSFFPGDVRFVADHAKRAMTTFPESTGTYYGVDYGIRQREGVTEADSPPRFRPDGSYPPNDLSWYANIPVPTSYMVTSTEADFFGGYDHRAAAGVVHVANHHIAPGKKQWTWGNQRFGYAWDRSLTERDGPYIELMAGVYTDNQPDFSFLAPWETKTFVQSWYPIAGVGVPQAANLNCALHVGREGNRVELGLYATHDLGHVTIVVEAGAEIVERRSTSADVAHPVVFSLALPLQSGNAPVRVRVLSGPVVLIEYCAEDLTPATPPKIAVEPAPPSAVETSEELYLIGLHLQQYRHATRLPELYWREALRRDPSDSRAHNAMGLWRLRRGEFAAARHHFAAAIDRITVLNSNPYDGEPYYNLGLAERFLGNDKQAYDALYKATWNAAWRGPAYFALAEIDCTRGNWQLAHDHLLMSIRAESENLNALNLRVYALEKLCRTGEAEKLHRRIRAMDPLDIHSLYREGEMPASAQNSLDLAFDFLRSGRLTEAAAVLRRAPFKGHEGASPIVLLTLAHVEARLGSPQSPKTRARAFQAPLDYCFPSRLEELQILEAATAEPECGASAFYLLGTWLYDRRRHEEAIEAWQTSARLRPGFATVWRNLGIALFNIRREPTEAMRCFDRAFELDRLDARLLYERDQLQKRVGTLPAERLRELARHAVLIADRDDLSVEVATLHNQLGHPEKALDVLLTRQFQPWEGGEGLVSGQYVRARLLLGVAALSSGQAELARTEFQQALHVPENLSEARHPLTNQSDVFYWIGRAYATSEGHQDAAAWYARATAQRGDFQQMAVKTVSEMTFWSGMAHAALGQTEQANAMFERIAEYAAELQYTEPRIDYFATSLPTMLLFDEDLQQRNRIEALFLSAQAHAGLGRKAAALAALDAVLDLDRNHGGASDLLRQLEQQILEVR